MKKRCTNPSCRRVFQVETCSCPFCGLVTESCPYCGKIYPRSRPVADRYAVVLIYTGRSKLSVAKVIRHTTGLGLRDAVTIIDNIPSLVVTGYLRSQAEALKADFRAVGGDARIIPASKGTHGIFVLPKKVD